MTSAPAVIGVHAVPKYATTPRGRARHRLEECSAVAEAIGEPLMPWQASTIRVGTQMKYGRPERRTVLITVPRQSGKTTIARVVTIDRLLSEGNLYSVYVAQSRQAAANRLRDITVALKKSGLDPRAKVTMGAGNERLVLSNGSRMEVMSPTDSAGHGESIDLAIVDEAWKIDRSVVDAAIRPAMAARPNAQMWMLSTQGTIQDSHLLNHYCAIARQDPQARIAYVEYSMPDGANVYDRERWGEWMPALGYTIDELAVIDDMHAMEPGEFRRAYGNIPRATSGEVIPLDLWDGTKADHAIPDGMVVAADASRFGATVATAHRLDDDLWHTDPIEWRDDEDRSWVVEEVHRLAKRATAVIVDPASPLSAVLPQLQAIAEEHAIPLVKYTFRERCMADRWLYEQLKAGTLTHSVLPALDEAVEGAVTTVTGDLWRFDRKRAAVDMSPLIACSMAAYTAHQMALQPSGVSLYIAD